jgi:ABC-2 type transport system ATP-binding protein
MTAASDSQPDVPGEYAVLTRGLTRRFGDFTAVDEVDLSVRSGEIFGFLGANGAGKTTTIRMLCGLLIPSDGEAWVDGLAVSRKADEVKRRIGYMSQRFSLYTDLSLEQNMRFYAGVYGLSRQEMSERIEEHMVRLNLTGYRRKRPSELPLGYRQRLALGCSVLHRPRILFLDEPTGGVDPAARRTFWDLIYEMADRGATVFVTTHYMDEAEYCGRISIMDRGRIVALGSPHELKRQENAVSMQEVFLRVVKP